MQIYQRQITPPPNWSQITGTPLHCIMFQNMESHIEKYGDSTDTISPFSAFHFQLSSLCNWPSSGVCPLYNIPSSGVKGTSAVLWSSANFCSISQNMHYKAPVASQHWKTNQVVWTWKDDWPAWRNYTYERPFTREGNYLVTTGMPLNSVHWSYMFNKKEKLWSQIIFDNILDNKLTLIGSECAENSITTSSLSSAGNFASSTCINSEKDWKVNKQENAESGVSFTI